MKTDPKYIEHHPLQPFLPDGAKVLFLGSFPPKKERWSMDFFYPNFINDMWRIVGIVFFNDRNHFIVPGEKRFDKDMIMEFCKEKGIALYDTSKTVIRLKDNASDKFLQTVEATDIGRLLQQIPECDTVVVTGQKAADTVASSYGLKAVTIGSPARIDIDGREITLYRMPSTSRAYPMSIEKKAEQYRSLFNDLNLEAV